MSRKKPQKRRAGSTSSRTASEFDREFVVDTFSEPSTDALRHWERARHKRGRPRKGGGVRVISISVETSLLTRADWAARRLGISRSELVARGLKAALAAAGAA